MTENPFDVTVRVGEVTDAESFPEADKPELVKLWIDLGEESVQSAAQLGYHHEPTELVGRQVLCATNLGSIRIAGFRSEALTVGVPGADGNPVLVAPDEEVPLGGTLYWLSDDGVDRPAHTFSDWYWLLSFVTGSTARLRAVALEHSDSSRYDAVGYTYVKMFDPLGWR